MKYRIVIDGLADGRTTPIDGAYLKSVDFEAREGRGTIVGTRDPKKAMLFDSHALAMLFWKTESKTVPTRPDGKPNRPFTAYTVTVEPVA
jgi:hypothetical protein